MESALAIRKKYADLHAILADIRQIAAVLPQPSVPQCFDGLAQTQATTHDPETVKRARMMLVFASRVAPARTVSEQCAALAITLRRRESLSLLNCGEGIREQLREWMFKPVSTAAFTPESLIQELELINHEAQEMLDAISDIETLHRQSPQLSLLEIGAKLRAERPARSSFYDQGIDRVEDMDESLYSPSRTTTLADAIQFVVSDITKESFQKTADVSRRGQPSSRSFL